MHLPVEDLLLLSGHRTFRVTRVGWGWPAPPLRTLCRHTELQEAVPTPQGDLVSALVTDPLALPGRRDVLLGQGLL